MSKLKSGVYLVRFNDIDKFFKDAENNGWKHSFDHPQEEIYDTLKFLDREENTIKQMVIPFSLDQEKRRVGYWTDKLCLESEVEETIKTWNDWYWTENLIAIYDGVSTGGTANGVKDGKKMGKWITNIDPKTI